ncbi:RTA1 like protein-domain-containing protein [Thelonectria olida]|uniref:RTA1 like protein-domain-containing protein n=1 Tax=Thelonectria olida TaxID=1576542 RepID=A0A9P9AT16_9HYPO|nr:RTA1 like protein-domain-containing protein [Thelonectria olida]
MSKMATLPNGLVTFGPNANCTLDLCPLEASLLRYRPSIPANVVFICVFGLSMLLHVWQGWRTKTWGFMSCMISGCILEIIGYIGRLIVYNNPFDFNGFLMQIICITVAPVFFCSAIYVLLSQVINYVDASISRIKPQAFYWFFIPCDVVSLVLQAVGGALSCVGSTKHDVEIGENISLAGLIFQVITLVIFISLFADYVWRAKKSSSEYRLDKTMLIFLSFLFFSTFFILVRCAYRIVELQEGYFSAIFRDEPLFIALESCIMCVAVVLLNLGHPGKVFAKKQQRPLDTEQPCEELELSVPSPRAGSPENVSVSDLCKNRSSS